ncbi:MAG: hypothetical protein EZS28_018024 [Streblomastix strix]|uniref:Uncharacterized protein n=1 Tax=Streblomastix strix TaxID=222440 RepID=A0A5J4VUT7_9EUKA|nr:MAG: hypothetical protein EZS28_018024 [Streblomastix strix]
MRLLQTGLVDIFQDNQFESPDQLLFYDDLNDFNDLLLLDLQDIENEGVVLLELDRKYMFLESELEQDKLGEQQDEKEDCVQLQYSNESEREFCELYVLRQLLLA